ncbi:type VI secretion system baseplate subunit TssF [Paraburkholderia phenazinium]|uniref:Type VI secretion system protein ImpG n=1 Tax=Paraburkholderia phenazinium TaxID=60549 RepID=A0A1G7PLA1_9BURK|nr:type VI secretion system baseplate subunit TssF [Paraburkholderia phenazinium]SDF86983.1 type VI secretion system protein ImpG [Paraburkholderia phenazinium]
MDDLISSYERELALLRASLAEFATRFPKIAARLSILGQHSEDLHVERLLQSNAMLNARISAHLEDDVPEFTKPLLEIQYPEYLRPFPSCTIACFEGSEAVARLTRPAVIKRRAGLKTRTGEYAFETAYDVTLAPLRIEDAAYRPLAAVPSSVQLPQETSGFISITFAALMAGTGLNGVAPNSIRVFVDGDQLTVAAVMDTLLQLALTAFVEVDGSGKWIALPAVPVSAAGFDSEDALIERDDGRGSAFRLLLEYFAFPQKFDFIDIDLAALLRGTAARRVSLHVPVSALHPDSSTSRAMRELSAANFRLSCTPVINLFRCPAEPVALKAITMPFFPLVAQTLAPEKAAVWSVDAVRLTMQSEANTTVVPITPFQSLAHHNGTALHGAQREPLFWMMERDTAVSQFTTGQDTFISFVSLDGRIAEPVGAEQIDADLRCTNHNLVESLSWGNPEGDFVYADKTLARRIVMLRAPGMSLPRPEKPGRYWNVVTMLSASPFSLDQSGLPALKELLSNHASSGSQLVARHIDAIVGLARESAMEWIVEKPLSRMVRGLRVRLTVDELALAGCTLSTFVRVLESVFVRYAPAHSFTQLLLLSAHNGAELARGRLLPGEITPV